MDNQIKVSVPANDLMALAGVGQMFLELARQKARTPTNELFVAEAKEQTDKLRQHECQCDVKLSDFPAGSNVIVHPGGGFEQHVPAASGESAFQKDEFTFVESPIDAGAAFGMPASGPDGRGTLYTGNGELNTLPQPGDVITTPAGQTGMIPTAPPFVGLAMPPVPPFNPAAPDQPSFPPTPFNSGVPVMMPAPTPPSPAPIVSGVKLDGEGLPWDRRIHASTKTFRQSDNTWKLIKGISPELVTTVKAELRVAMGQVQPTAEQTATHAAIPLLPTPPAPPVPPALTLVPPLPPPTAASEAGWPDPPAGPVTPPAPPTVDPYTEFVQFCTSNQQSGRLAFEAIKATCEKYGITQLPMLNARHDLIPAIHAELELLCK